MTIFDAPNIRKALIFLCCVAALFAGPPAATAAGSKLALAEVRNVVAAASQVPPEDPTAGSPLAMVAPSPEWSAIFPIIGLIAAVAVTQLLRRRRIAQIRSLSSPGQ